MALIDNIVNKTLWLDFTGAPNVEVTKSIMVTGLVYKVEINAVFDLAAADVTGVPVKITSNLVNDDVLTVCPGCDSKLVSLNSPQFIFTWPNGKQVSQDYNFKTIIADKTATADTEIECQLFLRFYLAPKLLQI